MTLIHIDGRQGEGGGQILRSALTLSILTGKAFRIEHIRANRNKPGLMRQHLTAVLAAAEISHAAVSGAEKGSQTLEFFPGEALGGNYRFVIGSAGSTGLVLQTVLLPLALAKEPSSVIVEGGTHNMQAPPFDFLEKAFIPLLNRMGANIRIELRQPGFYPSGGGRIRVRIKPSQRLSPLVLAERGQIIRRKARALLANLPAHIAERELKTVKHTLGFVKKELETVEFAKAPGEGNALCIEITSENLTEVFSGFGKRGLRAEEVAKAAVTETQQYLAAEVAVGSHLADQLLLLMALAGGGVFTTLPLSLHARTNIEIIRTFLDVSVSEEKLSDVAVKVTVQ